MQVKTIKKNIENKLNEWLNTITDNKLRESVRDNILVSGGSIASMFLNEPVNDYDIYLMDQGVLYDLVKYYTAERPVEIKVLNGAHKDDLIKKLEAKYGDKIETVDTAYAIALRTLSPTQVKLYFSSTNNKGGMKANEDVENPRYLPMFFSPNAISLSNDLQIVTRFCGTEEDIHKTFDYIHATNFFTFATGLVTNKAALESLLTKQLRYQGSMFPLTSIIRAKKFIKRGWNIGAGELLKIMFQISLLDLTNPDVLEEQLIGVDVAHFGALINALRDGGETLTVSYVNSMIDKVFNDED